MSISSSQQYAIALAEAKLKDKKREMFMAKPDSVAHAIKVVAYDRMQFELALMKKDGVFRTLLDNGVA